MERNHRLFRWPNVRDFLLLVIGVAIVLALRNVDSHVQDATEAANRSTATECRMLVMFEQPIDPSGPCADPDVKKYYATLRVVPLTEVVKELLMDLGITPNA